MDFPQFHFYKINQILLSLIGQWPYQSQVSKLIRRSIVIIIFINTLMSQFAALIVSNFDSEILLVIVPVLVSVIWAICAAIITYVDANKFEDIWKRMKEDWNFKRTVEEDKIKENYAETGEFLEKLCLGIGMPTVTLFLLSYTFASELLDLILPLNETRKHIFPFIEELFIDRQKYFYPLMLRTSINVLIMFTFAIGHVCMFIAHMQHIYGMFVVIGYRFEHAIPSNLIDVNCFIRDKIFHQSLIICFHRHKKALEFVSALEDYYKPHFILVLISSLFLLCPTFVQITDKQIVDTRLLLQVPIIIGFIFIAMIAGQLIIDLSSNLSEKIYFSPWYLVSPHLQKYLVLIIRRSDVPCCVSAGGIYVASLDCFRMIMQAGFTYYMALRQMRD